MFCRTRGEIRLSLMIFFISIAFFIISVYMRDLVLGFVLRQNKHVIETYIRAYFVMLYP
jgi:hypothetical protein